MVESPGGEILVYESPDGGVRVDVRLAQDTVWLTQRQMGELFDSTAENVLMHLQNVFGDSELEEEATTKEFLVVRFEGRRRIHRRIKHYNLDAIISVGYRVSSRRGVRFRQWATRTLREHLVQGYTLNRQRFERNARELESALALVRKTAANEALSTDQSRGLVDIIARYTQTFLLLERYDERLLVEPGGVAGGKLPTTIEARASVARLKQDLTMRGEASDLFGRELDAGLDALIGDLRQSVLGKSAYPSIESKAAHLLYFVIKNHPFIDGNKRIASLLFVEFLHHNERLFRGDGPVINDVGLAALSLLVAESAPKDMQLMVNLVMNMLAEDSP